MQTTINMNLEWLYYSHASCTCIRWYLIMFSVKQHRGKLGFYCTLQYVAVVHISLYFTFALSEFLWCIAIIAYICKRLFILQFHLFIMQFQWLFSFVVIFLFSLQNLAIISIFLLHSFRNLTKCPLFLSITTFFIEIGNANLIILAYSNEQISFPTLGFWYAC